MDRLSHFCIRSSTRLSQNQYCGKGCGREHGNLKTAPVMDRVKVKTTWCMGRESNVKEGVHCTAKRAARGDTKVKKNKKAETRTSLKAIQQSKSSCRAGELTWERQNHKNASESCCRKLQSDESDPTGYSTAKNPEMVSTVEKLHTTPCGVHNLSRPRFRLPELDLAGASPHVPLPRCLSVCTLIYFPIYLLLLYLMSAEYWSYTKCLETLSQYNCRPSSGEFECPGHMLKIWYTNSVQSKPIMRF